MFLSLLSTYGLPDVASCVILGMENKREWLLTCCDMLPQVARRINLSSETVGTTSLSRTCSLIRFTSRRRTTGVCVCTCVRACVCHVQCLHDATEALACARTRTRMHAHSCLLCALVCVRVRVRSRVLLAVLSSASVHDIIGNGRNARSTVCAAVYS